MGDGSSTTVNTGSDTFIMQTASCGQALQYFLGSVIGSSQNALAEAAQEAKASLGLSSSGAVHGVMTGHSGDILWIDRVYLLRRSA